MLKLAIFIIGIGILVAFLIFRVYHRKSPLVVGLMITGKNACREHFAKRAIDNFYEQDYPNKQLIIINHSPDYRVLQNNESDMVHEFYVEKTEHIKLGDLRNIALAMVPPDAVWTTWDDDDYRAPNYISVMMKAMRSANADVFAFKHRTEYNINNGYVWNSHLLTGFPLLFAKQDMRVLYKRIDTMEDMEMISGYRSLGKKVELYENDPRLYIRLVHGSNTSLYVDPDKRSIGPATANATFYESPVADLEIERVQNLVDNFYSAGIECSKSSLYR
jgi:hypothetical protein